MKFVLVAFVLLFIQPAFAGPQVYFGKELACRRSNLNLAMQMAYLRILDDTQLPEVRTVITQAYQSRELDNGHVDKICDRGIDEIRANTECKLQLRWFWRYVRGTLLSMCSAAVNSSTGW